MNPLFRAEAEQHRGYAVDDNECNAAAVTRILNTIKKHAEQGTAAVETCREYVAAETDSRIWIAYLR